MSFAPVLRSEWLKIRTVRSQPAALFAMLAVTPAFSALSAAPETADPQFDPLFMALFGVVFGQIAAVSFGAMAVSAEFHNGALRQSLAAVPQRGRWYAAKIVSIAVPVLLVGLPTAVAGLLAGRAGLGSAASGLTVGEQVRAVVGCAVYLMLMALFSAGLATVLRSQVATLSVLIPFILMVSFVVGDMSGTVADVLPDRAGQVILHQSYDGILGPWAGLAVSALWTAAALLAGAWRLRRRDA
ncbi:ABC transporter permease [Streptomyces sp. enrichment culture]|uniref:ABC transporter permease n=1 Tax=Streptomyces sp. enrichment culture TaxID=1795815 RepID=UPI003F54CE7C